MDTIKLPASVSDIDAAFLTKALSRGRPGVVVASVQIGTVILGTATKVRLLLEYNHVGHQHRLPPTLWLKAGFGRPYADIQIGLYTNEALFYQDFAPRIEGIELPKCYFAANAEGGLDGVVLLEDLLARNVTFLDSAPVSVDEAAEMLAQQASYHAVWWNQPELEKLPRSLELVTNAGWEHFFKAAVWNPIMARPHAAPVPKPLRDIDKMCDALRSLIALDRKTPDTLVHADAHINNTYRTLEGRLGLLDWQLTGRASAADDVSYFLITSLSIEDRRHHERDLLHDYHKSLSARCPAAFSFDDLWLGYRQFALHAFCWVGVAETQHPIERTSVITERACAAVEDLDTLEALGVAG